MPARPRIAVVGTGYWGISHVRTFAAEPRAELRWICDPDETALARAARLAPHARQAHRFEEVLTADDVDAVVIATPSTTHAELAIACLDRGFHVLVEKPLALAVADAQRIAAASSRVRRVVLVGHLMLYHPAVELLRAQVLAGELGDIYYLLSTRANLGRLRRDENALWSFGPHDISMIDYLLPGTPTTISARGGCYLQPGIADVVFLDLEFAPTVGRRPVMAHVNLSWLSPRKERRLTIVGSKKMVEFDDVGVDKLRIHDRGYDRPPEFSSFAEYLTLRDGDVFIPRVPMVEPLAAEARHFLDCLEGATPRTDVASGVRVVRTLAAAQASLERGGLPVAVGDAS